MWAEMLAHELNHRSRGCLDGHVACEVFRRFARGRPFPDRAEANLRINAVPLRPPIDETRPRRRPDTIVEPFMRPRDFEPGPDKFRPVVGLADSNLRRRKFSESRREADSRSGQKQNGRGRRGDKALPYRNKPTA